MKKLFLVLLASVFAMAMIVPAFAGQEPYVATVSDDALFPPWYISPKEAQWLHPNTHFRCENFDSSKSINRASLCGGTDLTARVGKGNDGKWKWDIILPKKPEGDLNITIQCEVLKPNEIDINECAGETGEIVGPSCTRGGDTLAYWALPTVEAVAYPGPYAETTFTTPFHLTAFRNPSTYGNWGYSKNTKNHQVLDGDKGSRIALKACFTKTIFVSMPVNGRTNALGEKERNLNEGDLISVLLYIPPANTVDIYCYESSVKIQGIGEPLSLIDKDDYDAASCKWTGGVDGIVCDHSTSPPTPPVGGTPVMCLDDVRVCDKCPTTLDPLAAN